MSSIQDFNRQIIEEFRSNEGRVGGQFLGRRLLLLHTTGARTGVERVNPLAFQHVGDAVAIFGSNGGQTKHPHWYVNILANPRVRVELGVETYDANARIATGEERAEIWERQKIEAPVFADYESTAEREIPVVVLKRV